MLRIYNTLSKKIEEFEPIENGKIGFYSCGPTVYDYQHIGHMRRYVGDDILVRALRGKGLEVKHVMNITDVGHLVSDADMGEDKMEKGARKFGLSAKELAQKFEKQFLNSAKALNILPANKLMRATEYIKDQIELIQILEEKGFTYKTSDGVYFDTSKFPNYGKLSTLDEIKEGARVEKNPEKRNPRDFALWKFSPKDRKREMEWESPWGLGFPGWHIECSAMSMLSLGPQFDIHTGGIDHIPIHHENEIAQSEAASGNKFVNYWVHHAFLLVEGKKMSKSLGNTFTVQDIKDKGFDPLSLRYLYFQTHYRQEMNFTWNSLNAAQDTLEEVWEKASLFAKLGNYNQQKEPSQKILKRFEEFEDAVDNDLNMPIALSALHQGLKEARDDFDTLFLLSKTDEILGLDFEKKGREIVELEEKLTGVNKNLTDKEKEVFELVSQREKLRKQKKFAQADQLRNKIKKLGYKVEDKKNEPPKVRKI